MRRCARGSGLRGFNQCMHCMLCKSFRMCSSSNVHVSVLIPVKNGGRLLAEVLAAVLSQQTQWPFEVLVIDSGSTDGSVDVVRQMGVRCETIAPATFGHGRTRNQLAEMAIGQFLVFITQDAKPASTNWLSNLVSACDASHEVAGSFGPHIAHPSARLITQRELAAHFSGFGSVQSVVRMDDEQRYALDQGYRQWLHFFSSNNACIRRSVWEKLPLPDVAFAEDQTWAKKAIEAGYAKAYAPDAAVYHSHDFSIWETLQRNFDEARCFAMYFGYHLQPKLNAALWTAAKLTARDYFWLKEAGQRLPRRTAGALFMSCIEFARMLGQYLGTHHQRLPLPVAGFVSRDDTLRRMKDGK